MLREELRRVRVAAADPLADELVQVADHLAVGREVLGAHRLDGLGHPGHELVEDLALQPLDQLVELLAGVRLEEVVVLEAADPLADVRRQAVELVEPARRDVAQHRAKLLGRLAAGLRGLVEPALDARALLGHDLVELAPDVAEDVVEAVPLEHRLPLALEAVDQVTQAGHVAAGRIAGPPATIHQPSERLGDVAFGHHVVGERIEDLVRREVGHLLAAVPGRIASRPRERVRRRRAPRLPARLRPARASVAGRACPAGPGVGGHRW